MHNLSPPPNDTRLFQFDLSSHSSDYADLFSDSVRVFKDEEKMAANKRKTLRYIRKDITALVNQADIFGTYRLFSVSRFIRVRLLDISSKGSLIASPEKLKPNRQVMLTLVFDSNKKFEIPARIVREIRRRRSFYGLEFEKVNDDLADYLVTSEIDWRVR
jgi:hypothetical protein